MSTTGLEHALDLKRAGRLDEAVIALEALLSERRDHALALAHLADVQVRRGRSGEAADALDRAEAIAGTTVLTARVRGDVAYRRQRWRDAARSYQEADALGAHDTWPLLQLARCHLRLGDLEAARGAAARAAERDERASGAWVLLGDIALRAERHDDAVTFLERAHERKPNDHYAYAKLVEARLARLPEDQRAREVEVLLRTSGRSNKHLLGVLAKVRSEAGDDRLAAEAWRERREQHHGDLYARKMEGYALRRAGDLDRAAAVMKACLLEDPADFVLFKVYVALEGKRGAPEDLRATLEQLLPIAGDRRGAVYNALRKLGPRDGRD